jgi:hypothetical protein
MRSRRVSPGRDQVDHEVLNHEVRVEGGTKQGPIQNNRNTILLQTEFRRWEINNSEKRVRYAPNDSFRCDQWHL